MKKGILYLIAGIFCIGISIGIHFWTDSHITTYVRCQYVERLESKYYAAREALAIEVENYIKTTAPTSLLNALPLIDLCSKYNIDLCFVLAQGHIESHFGTKGTARKTNSVFNVGAYDGHSAERQKKNGFYYEHPDKSIEPYLKLLTNNYLVYGKSELELLIKFVDHNEKRYASNKNYESMLQEKYNKLEDTGIIEAYNIYRMYKTQLGY